MRLLLLLSLITTACTGAVICSDDLAAGTVCVTETPTYAPSITSTVTETETPLPTQTPWVITQTPTNTATNTATPVITPTQTFVPVVVQRGDTWNNQYEGGQYKQSGLYARTCYPNSTPPPEPPPDLVPSLPPLHTGDTLLIPCQMW